MTRTGEEYGREKGRHDNILCISRIITGILMGDNIYWLHPITSSGENRSTIVQETRTTAYSTGRGKKNEKTNLEEQRRDKM